MPVHNNFGIFKTKKAKLLAIKYNLDLNNYFLYSVSHDKYVTYLDVLSVVDNLWLDHFIYHTKEPIKLFINEYNKIFYKLSNKYPQLLN
jgi:hypothetical protein